MNNMDTSDGLTSTGLNAFAVSNAFLQSQGQNFKVLKDLKTKWKLVDLSHNNTKDTFTISNIVINTSDILYIVKDDLSIHKITEPSITYVQHLANKVMTSNVLPSNEIIDVNNSSNAYLAFDNDESTNVQYTTVNDYIIHKFDTPQKILDIFIKCDVDYSITSLRIEGSTDGTNYATITILGGDNQIDISNGKFFSIQSPGMFTHYKFIITALNDNNLVKLNTLNLLSSIDCNVDTSSITAGEIPKSGFRFSDKVSLNDNYLTSTAEKATLEDDGLQLIMGYDDLSINDKSIVTKVEINTIGNSFKEITGMLYK